MLERRKVQRMLTCMVAIAVVDVILFYATDHDASAVSIKSTSKRKRFFPKISTKILFFQVITPHGNLIIIFTTLNLLSIISS